MCARRRRRHGAEKRHDSDLYLRRRTERKKNASTLWSERRTQTPGTLSRTDSAPPATTMGATVRKCRGVKRGGFAPLKDNKRAKRTLAPSYSSLFSSPPPPPLDRIVRYLPPVSLSPNFPPAFLRTLSRAPTACLCPRPLPAPSPSTAHSVRWMPRVNREQHDGGFGALRKRSSALRGHHQATSCCPSSPCITP